MASSDFRSRGPYEGKITWVSRGALSTSWLYYAPLLNLTVTCFLSLPRSNKRPEKKNTLFLTVFSNAIWVPSSFFPLSVCFSCLLLLRGDTACPDGALCCDLCPPKLSSVTHTDTAMDQPGSRVKKVCCLYVPHGLTLLLYVHDLINANRFQSSRKKCSSCFSPMSWTLTFFFAYIKHNVQKDTISSIQPDF